MNLSATVRSTASLERLEANSRNAIPLMLGMGTAFVTWSGRLSDVIDNARAGVFEFNQHLGPAVPDRVFLTI